jgi:hypothetical protein
MSRNKISLLILGCGILMFAFAACGGNDCNDVCNKAASCNLLPIDCITACENAPSQACGLDCDTDASCVDYGTCIINCGLAT